MKWLRGRRTRRCVITQPCSDLLATYLRSSELHPCLQCLPFAIEELEGAVLPVPPKECDSVGARRYADRSVRIWPRASDCRGLRPSAMRRAAACGMCMAWPALRATAAQQRTARHAAQGPTCRCALSSRAMLLECRQSLRAVRAPEQGATQGRARAKQRKWQALVCECARVEQAGGAAHWSYRRRAQLLGAWQRAFRRARCW
jgi:hypothetical protein